MKPLLPLATASLVAAVVLAPAPATSSLVGAVTASRGDTHRVVLEGVPVRVRPGTRQVLTVDRTTGWHARATYWQRTGSGWARKFTTTDGRIGYGGLVRAPRRVQGSGRTPLGTFRLPWAFGMHAQRAAWDPSYRRVRPGDYWVLDNRSRHYNRYRNKSRDGFRWRLDPGHPDASERLRDYPVQYEWAVVTSFNARQVRHRGGAIFVHVNGTGATAGWVSAPRWFRQRLVRRLDPDRGPVVAIGR